MNAPSTPPRTHTATTATTNVLDRLGLNRWLQLFLTIIAGTVVAVIAWSIIGRFLNIIILLIASFLVAFLLAPLVDRLEQGGVPRLLSILLVYIVIVGAITVGLLLLITPLTKQLNGLIGSLPSYLGAKPGQQSGLEKLLQQHGIRVGNLGAQLASAVQGAGATLLNSTLTIVTGVVNTITDILLILVIAFYFLLDGHAMHNRALRLLPPAARDRWFFFEATLNKVLGGYIRGQLIVAVTVGSAAGIGCYVLGVHFPIVIGVLAFMFEFIPMIGPVLGMVPAVLIALFQTPSPVVWVIVYFIVLQQVESNLIVPRVSGHAVGLHPLAALLSLLVGLELGGIGGALLSVPLAGMLYVVLMALYSDATGQSDILVTSAQGQARRRTFLARQLDRRRGRPGAPGSAGAPAPASTGTGDDAVALAPAPVANDRLATIQQEKKQLKEQFEADEAEQAVAETVAPAEPRHDRQAPDDAKSPSVTV